MKPGDFFVIRTDGWAAPWIRLITRSDVNHAGILGSGGRTVEAAPHGAYEGYASDYPHAQWSHLDLTDEQRLRICQEAYRLVGTPYSWVDCAAIGIADISRAAGIPNVHVPEWVRKRLNRRTRLMCSQLVDTAYANAGVRLFTDDRLPGDVSPGDLANLLVAQTDSLSKP